MPVPDYHGGSIVNLMASIRQGLGAPASVYPPARLLAPDELAAARHVVLFVVDGLGFEYLERNGARAGLARHLRGHLTSVFPSTTASAVTTFVTGTAPQQHALTGWFTWFRELGAVIAPLPFKPRFGGAPLGSLGVEARALFDHPSLFRDVHRRAYIVLPKALAESDYSRAYGGDAQRMGYSDLGDCLRRVRDLLRSHRDPLYVYAYWPEIDSLAHRYGVGSGRVRRRFAALEEAFDGFLSAVAGTGTAVLLTADHGLVDTSAASRLHLDQHPQLAHTLLIPLCGEPRAVFCYVRPECREPFEDYVRTRLAHAGALVPSRTLLEQGYFGLGEPHPRLAERIGHYAILMQENYVLRDSVPGEETHPQIGVHGGLSSAEMYVPLIVASA